VEFYPDAGEEIPKDFLPEKGKRVSLVTRRCIKGILVMLNNTPII
jgi:hypothetical protein